MKSEVRLLALGLVLALLFAADAVAATVWTRLPLDLEITRTVQAIPWGALVAAFLGVDWTEGVRQAILGVAVVTAVFLFKRRAALWAFASFLSGGAYYVVQLLVARPRPPASLVHVVRHASGHSFPSGHLTFFTWVAAVLVVAFVPRRLRAAAWAVSGVLLAVIAIGRIYEGEHWPSDVAGGVLLGAAWTLVAHQLLGVREQRRRAAAVHEHDRLRQLSG